MYHYCAITFNGIGNVQFARGADMYQTLAHLQRGLRYPACAVVWRVPVQLGTEYRIIDERPQVEGAEVLTAVALGARGGTFSSRDVTSASLLRAEFEMARRSGRPIAVRGVRAAEEVQP